MPSRPPISYRKCFLSSLPEVRWPRHSFLSIRPQLGKGKASESARLANTTLTLVILVLGTVSALGALFAPWLTRCITRARFPRRASRAHGQPHADHFGADDHFWNQWRVEQRSQRTPTLRSARPCAAGAGSGLFRRPGRFRTFTWSSWPGLGNRNRGLASYCHSTAGVDPV